MNISTQPEPGSSDHPFLSVRELSRYFMVRRKGLAVRKVQLKAVDHIGFDLDRGQTIGIVGESGCGKSTAAKIIVNIDRPTSGQVFFKGASIAGASPDLRRRLTRAIQYVFQDPLGALDPRMDIIGQVMEPYAIHGLYSNGERRDRAAAVLKELDLNEQTHHRYPHEISGGQRQRVVLARALTLEPELLVCDEPISAIDVSLQAQVINLLARLRDERGLTMIFISHDLRAVRHLCDRAAVMYLGKMVEMADNDDLFNHPAHPYTQALLSAVPIPRHQAKRKRIMLNGDPPSPINPPSGCRFHPRCRLAQTICMESEPIFRAIGRGRWTACHFPSEPLSERGDH